MLTRTVFSSLLCCLLFIAGCFETPLSLGPEGDSKVDPTLVGDYEVASRDHPDNAKAKMFIRNLDGRHYFVEWVNAPNEGQQPEEVEPVRMVVFVAKVGNATFAHARDLPADGSIPDKHLVLRFSVDNGQLILRNLSEEFFKDKSLASDADFRRVVEENLENPDMYDHDQMSATRMGK
jgi:hypothetical protein